MKVSLFPLRTVLYPGGPLPLRIFEPRYLDMLSASLKGEQPFGVVLIRRGRETGAASIFDIGTLASVTDWYRGSDGVLGVTAVGGQRFRVLSTERRPNGLYVGEVELLPERRAKPLPDEYKPLAGILADVLDDLGRLYEALDRRYDDAGWVGYRFAEILPISPEEKQSCLETDDPVQRLKIVRKVLHDVRGADLN